MSKAKITYGGDPLKPGVGKQTALVFTWHPGVSETDAVQATKDLGVNVHEWWRSIGVADVEIINDVSIARGLFL